MFVLKKISFKIIKNLVKEADGEKIFLPSISDKNFSVENFFTENNKKIFLYGSYLDNNLIGFLSVLPQSNQLVSLGPMYISKEFRKCGFGEKQLKEIIFKLKQTNISGIKTKTWGENKPSRHIFEKLRFKLVDEKPNARVNGDSTVKYYLELRPN